MAKKLTEKEIITEEVNFKVRLIMEKKVREPGNSWCDVCNY